MYFFESSDIMDKTEKLALARKKLRKFQAKTTSSTLADSAIHHQKEVNGVLGRPSPKITRTEDALAQEHSQSLDILVSEKSSLADRLSQVETQLQQKQNDCFAYQNEISSLQRRLEEGSREREQLVKELERKNKIVSQSSMNDRELRGNLQSTKKSLEDLAEENKELLSRVTAQSKELLELSSANRDLQNKLSMQEILIQQLQSSSSQPSTPGPLNDNRGSDKIEELEGEISRLLANVQSVTREKDQANSDVAALREALLNTQQDNARKVGELQTQLKESEIEMTSLSQQLSSHSNSTGLKDKEISSLHHSLEVLNKERDDLKMKMQQLVSDNSQLSRLYSSAEDTVSRLEGELSRVRREVVDQQSLMSTISQDKESISRAVAQNKDLKEQLAELQEAFVQKSHQNMELATALETEKYQNQKMVQRLAELEEELAATEKRQNEEMDKTRPTEIVREDKENEEIIIPNDRSALGIDNSSQVQELSMECVSLREERDKLLEELRRLSSPTPPSPAASSAMDDNQDGSIIEDTSLLQQSFSALQERFTCVMKDKADLLDRLQVMEHTIVQLSGENETIAEYVTLYQTQREALKVKFSEKDRMIEQLHQEKNSLQLKLREVQMMVSRLDHTHSLSLHQQDQPMPLSAASSSNGITSNGGHHHHYSPPASLPVPAHAVSTTLASSSAVVNKSQEGQGGGMVEQIVSFIEEELTYGSASSVTGHSLTTAQCPCCSGQLIVI